MTKKLYFKISDILKNLLLNADVIYLAENIDWVVKWEGKQMIKELNKQNKLKGDLRSTTVGARNKILHFGSVNTFFEKNGIPKKIHKSNKVILTWYHVISDDKKTKLIPQINGMVDIVHTACNLTKEELIRFGFDREKIIVIPLGMDLDVFRVKMQDKNNKFKSRIGLPKNKIIIGSFQKDGNGWGEGLEPKLIKGPDIFCDVVEKISKEVDIHVLLTGPSRGYVKNRLKKAGISYTHKYLENYLDIVDYFNILDLYIISSRVEGGPKAILESWATGVPLVSTRVGMISDIATHGKDVYITEIEDVDNLVKYSLNIIRDNNIKKQFISNGLKEINKFSWGLVSKKYYDKIYSKLR